MEPSTEKTWSESIYSRRQSAFRLEWNAKLRERRVPSGIVNTDYRVSLRHDEPGGIVEATSEFSQDNQVGDGEVRFDQFSTRPTGSTSLCRSCSRMRRTAPTRCGRRPSGSRISRRQTRMTTTMLGAYQADRYQHTRRTLCGVKTAMCTTWRRAARSRTLPPRIGVRGTRRPPESGCTRAVRNDA